MRFIRYSLTYFSFFFIIKNTIEPLPEEEEDEDERDPFDDLETDNNDVIQSNMPSKRRRGFELLVGVIIASLVIIWIIKFTK